MNQFKRRSMSGTSALRWRLGVLLLLLIVGGTAAVVGQQRRGRSRFRGRGGVPEWNNDLDFANDVFTFVRIRYSSSNRYRRGGGWSIDYPDSDLNLSYRLQQLTSMKVDPKGKILELTDEELFDYPFIYIVEPGRLTFYDEEVIALRRYLLNGGFLMVDDFWGDDEWDNFYYEIKHEFAYERPNFEFYCGWAMASGIQLDVPPDSRLFTTCDNLRQVYGIEWNPPLDNAELIALGHA